MSVSDGEAQVKVHDPEVRIVYREATAVPEAEVTKMLRRPFDLQNEAPARWLILKDAKVLRVYLVGHHIVVDGTSMSLISGEFIELIEDFNEVLPPLAEFSQMHMIEVSCMTPSHAISHLTFAFIERHAWNAGLRKDARYRS
jgi:hypothetical protein